MSFSTWRVSAPPIAVVSVRLSNKDSASALTVMLYDHCLVLSDEVRYIWRRKVGMSKCIYVYNRYCAEAGLLYSAYSEHFVSTRVLLRFS